MEWLPQSPTTGGSWSCDGKPALWSQSAGDTRCLFTYLCILSHNSPPIGWKNESLNENSLRRKWIFQWTGKQKDSKSMLRADNMIVFNHLFCPHHLTLNPINMTGTSGAGLVEAQKPHQLWLHCALQFSPTQLKGLRDPVQCHVLHQPLVGKKTGDTGTNLPVFVIWLGIKC